MIDAIVLAGKELSYMEFNNRPMVLYVIEVLLEVKEIQRIVIVGDSNKLNNLKNRVYKVVESGESFAMSARSGGEALDMVNDFIVLSSDIPLISKDAIEDFIKKSKETKGEFIYPLIRKENILKKYPSMKRSYFKIKEGTFTGGNIAYLKKEGYDKGIGYLEDLYKYRKNSFKLAKMFSLSGTIGLILGILTINYIQNKLYKITNIKSFAIISDYVEIACDVDKDSDIEMIKEILK